MSGVQPSSLLDFFLFLMVKGKSEALNTFSLIREINAGATLPASVLFGMTGPFRILGSTALPSQRAGSRLQPSGRGAFEAASWPRAWLEKGAKLLSLEPQRGTVPLFLGSRLNLC